MKYLALAFAISALGCGAATPDKSTGPNKTATALTAKLKGMTPPERKDYLLHHPQEAMEAMGGIAPKPR